MQIFSNILFTASNIFLMALSFSIVFSVTHFFHFAHGAVFAFSAYFVYMFIAYCGLPLSLSVPAAVLSVVVLGCFLELFFYRPIRLKGTSSLVLLLTSLGLYVVLQNIISMAFGDDTKTLRPFFSNTSIDFLGATITKIQLITICTSIVMLFLVSMLAKTRIGMKMRAVASDSELAKMAGIEIDKTILWSFALGSGSVGILGVLVAFDVGATPTMGLQPLMMGVVAVVIGGISSTVGIAFASLLLAMCLHLAAWNLGAQWQEAAAFFIFLIFLLFRPEGFSDKKVKKAYFNR